MRAFETTVGCLLLLGALSITPTEAFARGVTHGHGGDFTTAEDRAKEIPHDDASKLHTVLKHPEEINSGAVKSELKAHGPEVVTLEGSARGMVHEDDVAAVHPESKTKSAAETVGCHDNPGSC